MKDLFGPLLPVLIGIAIVGVIVACLAWLLEHPVVLISVLAVIAAGVFVLIKGKFIGSNRV